MIRHLKIFLAIGLTLSLAFCPLSRAEKVNPLDPKISDIVAKFPAQTTAAKDALATELIALGPEGIMRLCRMLAPPGDADDSKVRYAINGLATYVASPHLEGQRKIFIRALTRALEQEESPEIRAFLISQVELCGKNESVKLLKKYLLDPKLSAPTVRSLVTIGTPAAEAAILKALNHASNANRLSLINALGDLRSRAATKKILPFASSNDAGIRQAALYALANTGDPLAGPVLKNVLLEASFYERSQAPSLYLLYARRLAESGNRTAAEGICRRIIKNYTASGETHVSSAALSLLADIMGKEAVEDLFAALGSPHTALRSKALELINRFKEENITAKLVAVMKAAPAEAQTQIIFSLAVRRDKTAFPAVREKLKSDDKALRLAAIPAATRLGGSEVLPDLFGLLASQDSDEIATIEQSLLQFSKAQVVPEAVKVLEKVPVSSQAALIRVMAERGAAEDIELIFAKAQSADENVRLAAMRALEPLVTENELARLIALLGETRGSQEKILIQNAIVASASQIADAETRADLILEVMSKARGEHLANLIKPLPEIGGKKAFEAVLAQTRSDDLEVQTAAVYALSQWPDFRAVTPLLDICRTTTSRKFLNLSLQGIVRLVNAEELSSEEKFKLLADALVFASELGEKKILLEGFSGVNTMDSLRLISSFLDDPDLSGEAARIAALIALPFRGEEDGLAGIEVIRTLKKASGLIADENFKNRTDDYVQRLLAREGFRPLFNGQDLGGWKGLVGDPPTRSRMSPQELEKAQAEADADMLSHWKAVDGILVFDGAGHSLCTTKDYRDFEMFVDWKIEPKGDSGIYLRGSPQVQIWDPAERPEGSGGLYNNEKGPNKPLKRADNPVGEWNSFFIRMTGERVTVYLNNVLVVDDVVMENYWERDQRIYPSGQVELQAHSTPLYFRGIYIREIKL